MNNLSLFLSSPFNQPYIYLLLVADLVLRGLALYKSARNEQKVWFVALLIVNTLGILPLVYLILQKRNSIKQVVKKTAVKKVSRKK
jgi:hypothetical protein